MVCVVFETTCRLWGSRSRDGVVGRRRRRRRRGHSLVLLLCVVVIQRDMQRECTKFTHLLFTFSFHSICLHMHAFYALFFDRLFPAGHSVGSNKKQNRLHYLPARRTMNMHRSIPFGFVLFAFLLLLLEIVRAKNRSQLEMAIRSIHITTDRKIMQ